MRIPKRRTFGYDIYTRWAADEKSRTYLMALMSHELMHSKQYEHYDRSLSNFGYHYFKEFEKANQSYENNKLEAEAFEDAPRVAAPNCCLVSQRGSEGTESSAMASTRYWQWILRAHQRSSVSRNQG